MARFEHLPIYKAALDLTVQLELLVAGFSRYHKYTLGSEMRNASPGAGLLRRLPQERWVTQRCTG